MKVVDYYDQDDNFLTLIEKLGGCVEDREALSKRAEEALHESDYFFVECKKAKIRLKGADEIARAINIPLREFVK